MPNSLPSSIIVEMSSDDDENPTDTEDRSDEPLLTGDFLHREPSRISECRIRCCTPISPDDRNHPPGCCRCSDTWCWKAVHLMSVLFRCIVSYIYLVSIFLIVGGGFAWVLDLIYVLLVPPTLGTSDTVGSFTVISCYFATTFLLIGIAQIVSIYISALSDIWIDYESLLNPQVQSFPPEEYRSCTSYVHSPFLFIALWVSWGGCIDGNRAKIVRRFEFLETCFFVAFVLIGIFVLSFGVFTLTCLIILVLFFAFNIVCYFARFACWFYNFVKALYQSQEKCQTLLKLLGQDPDSTQFNILSFITIVLLILLVVNLWLFQSPWFGQDWLIAIPGALSACLLLSNGLIRSSCSPQNYSIYRLAILLLYLLSILACQIISFIFLSWPLSVLVFVTLITSGFSLIPSVSDSSASNETEEIVHEARKRGDSISLWSSWSAILLLGLLLLFFGVLATISGSPGHFDPSKSPVIDSPWELPLGSDPYQICFEDFEGLRVTDLALFAQMAYKDPTSIQADLDLWFENNATWQLVYSQSTLSPGFLEFYNSVTNSSVISVRGTVFDSSDWIQNADIWQAAAILQAADLLGPGLRLWPLGIVQTVVEAMNIVKVWSKRESTSFYFKTIQNYIDFIRPQRAQIMITGHSLGGGLANILGAKNKLRSLGFSAPGILYSATSLNLDTLDILEWTANIQPQKDIVPKIDAQSNMNQWIECQDSVKECHNIELTLCTLLFSCGQQNNKMIAECTSHPPVQTIPVISTPIQTRTSSTTLSTSPTSTPLSTTTSTLRSSANMTFSCPAGSFLKGWSENQTLCGSLDFEFPGRIIGGGMQSYQATLPICSPSDVWGAMQCNQATGLIECLLPSQKIESGWLTPSLDFLQFFCISQSQENPLFDLLEFQFIQIAENSICPPGMFVSGIGDTKALCSVPTLQYAGRIVGGGIQELPQSIHPSCSSLTVWGTLICDAGSGLVQCQNGTIQLPSGYDSYNFSYLKYCLTKPLISSRSSAPDWGFFDCPAGTFLKSLRPLAAQCQQPAVSGLIVGGGQQPNSCSRDDRWGEMHCESDGLITCPPGTLKSQTGLSVDTNFPLFICIATDLRPAITKTLSFSSSTTQTTTTTLTTPAMTTTTPTTTTLTTTTFTPIITTTTSFPPTGWFPLADMPTPRGGLCVVTLNRLVYAIGGSNGLRTNEVFNISANSWASLAPLPVGTSEMACATCRDLIYLIGGRTTDGVETSDVYTFDPLTQLYSLTTALPVTAAAICAVSFQDFIYVVGLGPTYRFNPDSKVWDTLASSSTPHQAGGCTLLDGKIYLVGGADASQYLATTEVYTIATNSWQLLADTNFHRWQMTLTTLGNQLLAIGGITPPGEASPTETALTASTEVYSLSLNQWAMYISFPHPVQYPASFSMENLSCVVGGSTNSGVLLSSMYCLVVLPTIPATLTTVPPTTSTTTTTLTTTTPTTTTTTTTTGRHCVATSFQTSNYNQDWAHNYAIYYPLSGTGHCGQSQCSTLVALTAKPPESWVGRVIQFTPPGDPFFKVFSTSEQEIRITDLQGNFGNYVSQVNHLATIYMCDN